MLIDYVKSKSDDVIIHIDMGAELRALRDAGSVAGQLTGGTIDAGNRMPDFMPIYLQTKKIVENIKTGKEHVIADGLARGADQTRAYDDAMQYFGRDNFQIVYIELPEEEIIGRLLARGRSDDTEEKIKTRLGWYKTEVEPQVKIFEERGRTVHRIDGSPDPETIHKDILAKLGLT
jgi:adenylate kinase